MTTGKTSDIRPWTAACVQAYWNNYNPNIKGELQGDDFKKHNLRWMCDYIDACFTVGAMPRPVRLIAFPEFSIGGLYNATTSAADVRKAQAITIPGPETAVLAKKAEEHNVYIVACNHENDPAIPDYFFNTAFIINPKGKVILKYRKLNVRFGCNPHDILSTYVNPVTVKNDPLPVVDTEIGRLSCMICGDINIPEIPRAYGIKGADVIIRCDSGYGCDEMAVCTLRTRARDNKIYIVNENWSARIITTEESKSGNPIPCLVDTSGGGGAIVIDWEGQLIAQPRGTAPQIVMGLIDITELRKYRETCMDGPGGIKTELWAPFYDKTIYPPNKYLTEGPLKMRSDPAKIRWDMEGKTNWKKLWDFYPEDSVK